MRRVVQSVHSLCWQEDTQMHGLLSPTERPKAGQVTGYRLKPALPLCGSSSSSSSSRTGKLWYGNDPSAGSPTETLLRLLLPLDDQI